MMIDPFTAWSRMVAAGLQMQTNWLRGMETLQASNSVIDARTGKMRDAASAPMQADFAEFTRMVPEKVEAFSRSAQAVTRDTLAMHGAWTAQMQRVGLMMLSGRVPTLAETSALATHSTEYALGAITASARLGGAALAPVHRAATGNARRLKRAKR
jgi:ABC-type taurine transport system substrate-binding protein